MRVGGGTGSQRAGRKGSAFTLIEVLATLVLMAIVLPTAMKGVSLATAAAGSARDNLEAASLAESKLNELVAENQWNNNNMSGDFGDAWPGYGWNAQISAGDLGLMELRVQVTWTARGSEHSVALSTLAYDTTQQ